MLTRTFREPPFAANIRIESPIKQKLQFKPKNQVFFAKQLTIIIDMSVVRS